MIRLVNEKKAFANNKQHLLSSTHYPKQDTRYVGKYTTIRFKDQRIHNSIYDRFIVPCDYKPYGFVEDKELFVKHSIFFEVMRFDMEEPFRAILMDDDGRIIVTTTELLKSLLYIDLPFCDSNKSRANILDLEYVEFSDRLSPTEDNKQAFFDSYMKETIHQYPIQNMEEFGKEAYIEYPTEMTLDKKDTYSYKNDYTFTEEMKENLHKGDVVTKTYPDEILQSYPTYYNPYSKSQTNDIHRSTERGTIIRSDLNEAEGYVVVAVTNGDTYKFICQDEARIFYNTEK